MGQTRNTAWKVVGLFASLLVAACASAYADQLQWNEYEVCAQAVRELRQVPILLSYCSLADNERIEVWRIQGAQIVETSAQGLYEVVVVGQRLYESRGAYTRGAIQEPVAYIGIKGARGCERFASGIDLAYTYVPVGDGVFRCLGRVLGLECVVPVEALTFPGAVAK